MENIGDISDQFSSRDQVILGGIPFDRITMDDLISRVAYAAKLKKRLIFALSNAEFVVEASSNPFLRAYLQQCHLNVADGMSLVFASRILPISNIPERITGTDLVPNIMEASERENIKVFFLGGAPGIAEKARANLLKKFPRAKVVGVHHGFFQIHDSPNIIEKINESDADILMVCFGNPKQEQWITDNAANLNVPVIFGNGGALDFWSGIRLRAPLWMQRAGLEWFFRLLQDPTCTRLQRQLRCFKLPYIILRGVFIRSNFC